MRLAFHGGMCCGIKTVFDMGYSPNHNVEELFEDNDPHDDPDMSYEEVSSFTRFFTDAAPQETGRRRLERYIRYMEEHRPNNILECVLANYDSGGGSKMYDQQLNWGPTLLELGFKMVNSHKNSNSGNSVFVYHKNIGDDISDDED